MRRSLRRRTLDVLFVAAVLVIFAGTMVLGAWALIYMICESKP